MNVEYHSGKGPGADYRKDPKYAEAVAEVLALNQRRKAEGTRGVFDYYIGRSVVTGKYTTFLALSPEDAQARCQAIGDLELCDPRVFRNVPDMEGEYFVRMTPAEAVRGREVAKNAIFALGHIASDASMFGIEPGSLLHSVSEALKLLEQMLGEGSAQ